MNYIRPNITNSLLGVVKQISRLIYQGLRQKINEKEITNEKRKIK